MKKGYNLNYRATYAIEEADIIGKDDKKAPLKGILFAKGKNSLCVPFDGEYFIKIPKCYQMKKKENNIPFEVPIKTLGSNVN